MSIVGSNVLAGASGQGGYFLKNSLRFRSSVNGDLYRDVTTTGNRKTFTYSCWLKITKVDTTQIFSCGTSGSSVLQARIVTNNGLQIYQESGGATNFQRYTGSSAYLRDFSAWYHTVFAVDTTQATAGDRVKVYLNGVQLTSFSSSVDPSLNYDTLANYNDMWVGSYLGNVTSDTYQTEVHFLDGYAATADDFGEFDGATGVWKPKEYVGGNYGTNGFYLPMTETTQAELQNTVKFNSTTATAKEVTGVGFSPDLVWFKSTSNVQNHYLIDTVRGGNSFLYSNATNAENTSQQWIDEFGSDGFTATNNVLSNNYDYVAWCWDAGANQASTGISSVQYRGSGVTKKVTGFGFSPDLVWIKKRGDGTNTTNRDHVLFDTVRGANVQLKLKPQAEATLTDEVMSFDSDGFTAGASDNVNGTNAPYIAWCWDAGNSDPVSNTQGDITSTVKASDATGFSIVTWTASGVADDRVGHGLNSAPEFIIYKDRDGTGRPYVWTTAIDGSDDYLFLDGTNAANDQPVTYTSPTSTTISNYGYGSSASMLAYCFKSVSGVSDIGTYQGNGSASGPTVTTGFRPGFLLIKGLDVTGGASWLIVDGTRNPFNPVDASLYADDQADEGAADRVNFTDTGFEVITTSTLVNENTKTYLYMAFKGSYSDYVAPFNTDGTIDSRVKANPEKGFSIVSYEGNSTADQTVGHGLSSAPEMIVLKNRDAANYWIVQHKDLTSYAYNLYLQDTTTQQNDAQFTAAHTSSTFQLRSGGSVNTSGNNYIAYCFHSVAGYSSFGSYVGNGSTSGTVVNTGFRPGFVLLKSVDATTGWIMVDAVRDPDNLVSQYLYADLTSADATYTNIMEFTDTGFELRIAGGASNTNNINYIYMAFADTRDAQFNFDASGNKNNFIPSGNINSNASGFSSYDIMTDVPTLTDENTANYCTLNALTLNAGGGATTPSGSSSDGNLKWIGTGGNDNVFGTMAASSGKWYYEIEIVANPNTLVAGWSTTDELADYTQSALVYYNSAGIRNGNRTVVWDTDVTTGLTFSVSDIMGFALDIDSGDLKVYQNNSLVSTITLPADKGDKWIPAFGDSSSTDASFTVNFGQQPFAYTPPTGFLPLNTYNLPDSTIVDGSKHMNTVLYTGNGTAIGSGGLSVTGVGFQPDLVWGKRRDTAAYHGLVDVIRGGTKLLFSNSTDAETTYSEGISTFDSDGFTVGNLGNFNSSGGTYVSWNWKANGSGVSNSDGSITSTVSANTTSGFSIVSWTGNATAGATVGHGLGIAPEMVIVKNRDSAYNWTVYHKDLTSATYVLLLNSTSAELSSSVQFNSTAPSSSVFTLGWGGSDQNTNSAADHVAYCFAPVEGFSSFGKYTGNGSADGPFIYTGFRPAWIMIKRTDGSGMSWALRDTTRDSYNPAALSIFADLNVAEGSGNTHDLLSNGFKLRSSSGNENLSGGTFVYAAFAENPFKNSLAR